MRKTLLLYAFSALVLAGCTATKTALPKGAGTAKTALVYETNEPATGTNSAASTASTSINWNAIYPVSKNPSTSEIPSLSAKQPPKIDGEWVGDNSKLWLSEASFKATVNGISLSGTPVRSGSDPDAGWYIQDIQCPTGELVQDISIRLSGGEITLSLFVNGESFEQKLRRG